MAYAFVPDEFQNVQVSYIDYSRRHLIEFDPILLLVEEVIDYSLRCHNLHGWIPPQNLHVLRTLHRKTYFNANFAATVLNPNTEEEAISLAFSYGFNVRRWLDFTDHEEARSHMEYYLLIIFRYYKPYLFQMFSFACYVSRLSMQINRNSLVNDIVWAFLTALRKILPYEEYYNEHYFVSIEYNNNNLPDGYQLHDFDEGIGGIEGEGPSSGVNNELLSESGVNSILLFVEELIDYSLRYDNLQGWISPVDLRFLRRDEARYFNENLGRALNHRCAEEEALYVARERGFNEQRWLEIYRAEDARCFQEYFLWQVFYDQNVFRVLSFACYVSKVSMQNNRNGLVKETVLALVNFLCNCYPYHRFYREFNTLAIAYNNNHHHFHEMSDDEGVAANEEVLSSQESNETDSSGTGPAQLSDTEDNETERNVSPFLVEANERREKNESEYSETASELDVSEEESGSDVSKDESGSDVSKDESESDVSKDESESDVSKEAKGIHAPLNGG